MSEEGLVEIQTSSAELKGILKIPPRARGIVLFAHGSGSNRNSRRNRVVAEDLNESGLATLLFDMLTKEEEEIDARTRRHRFDIGLLATRLTETTEWLTRQDETHQLNIGYFGASTGAAAAIVAASWNPGIVKAIVSRGGRPDLAGKEALGRIHAPILLLVGGDDTPVIRMNEAAVEHIVCHKHFEIIPDAGHLFEEPGKLADVILHARQWFREYLE
ncbi:dienelactone hydrolase family protein [bacterium]|nr:dienelactone hydrolase family protein [bacterium]